LNLAKIRGFKHLIANKKITQFDGILILVTQINKKLEKIRKINYSSACVKFTSVSWNYVTGRRQFTKVKVDRWLSSVYFPEKMNM
jgi:hypothetical protein